MKQQILSTLPLLLSLAAAHPAPVKREVPQEQSHKNILDQVNTQLKLNNPDNIQDAVFALLGAKAAAEGAGNIKDTDCLQQAVADQAFTNAKAANDVAGMTSALVFRALERNTGSVGLASAPCVSIQAVNPEIAALQQHQDPASDGAAALNKQIAQELAAQISAIGGDPLQALEASTFAPGKIGDPTAKGNTCDDANDANGCINTLKLRVDDLTQDEVLAAAKAGPGAAGLQAGAAASNVTAAAGNSSVISVAPQQPANNNDDNNNNGNNGKNNGNGGNGGNGRNGGNAAGGNDLSLNDILNSLGGNNNNNLDLADLLNNGGNNRNNNGAASLGGLGNLLNSLGLKDRRQAGGAADFGTCNDLSIKFGLPSDGRKENAFEPSDLATFPHGSALGIGVITNFICSQAGNKCGANAAAVAQCNQAAQAATGLTGQAAANAFNQAIGA